MLTVITGPMFSGKTERLISLCTAHYFAGHEVMAFKPSNDDRYNGSFITSHANAKWLAEPVRPDKSIQICNNATECCSRAHSPNFHIDVVAIDEAQFFESQDLIKAVETLLYEFEMSVIISGLSQDSDGKPFGAMPHLLAIADDIIHLKSVCAKSKKIGAATRTYRKDKTNTNQVAVGGSEMYEPRSFETWLESRK
jgi:thymidine kinase